MSTISKLYEKFALSSPYIEVMLRRLYWHNVKRLGKFNPHKASKRKVSMNQSPADFEKVLGWLRKQGVGNGDLLIVHSGYGELEGTGLSPEEIIEKLLELIGPTGTLAMPVIRHFKEEDKARKEGKDLTEITRRYNVKKTLVCSGMLPYTLMTRPDSVTSLFPLNPLCAVGPFAEEMMRHNLDGEYPSPHGPNSSWKFCFDHGVKVCSIGTDMEHHCTIGHVMEEAFGDWYWPDELWYNKYKFEIIDEYKNSKEIIISNRKEDWGKLYGAELKLNKDAKEAGALISDSVSGITVGYVDPYKLYDLRKSKGNGYPYYVPFFVNVRKMK